MMTPNSWYIDQARRADLQRAATPQHLTIRRSSLRYIVGAWMVRAGQRLQYGQPTRATRTSTTRSLTTQMN